jgi:hypothetical protein
MAASAVLYSAVVLLGVKAASPSVLDRGGGGDQPVVLIRPHDSAVPGPRKRLPQASPGPARHQGRGTQESRTIGGGTLSSAPQPQSTTPQPSSPSAPTSPRPTESKAQSSTTPRPAEQKPILEVKPSTLPPPVSELPVPTVTVPAVTIPNPPVQLPQTPALPTVPQLPGVSYLPG